MGIPVNFDDADAAGAIVDGWTVASTQVIPPEGFLVTALVSDAIFTDRSGAPGSVTANTLRGRVAIAAAANSAVVTNSLVTANSLVIPVVESADATLVAARCAPAAGSFTVLGNAAATATCNIGFVVIN